MKITFDIQINLIMCNVIEYECHSLVLLYNVIHIRFFEKEKRVSIMTIKRYGYKLMENKSFVFCSKKK